MLAPVTMVFRRAFGLWALVASKALHPIFWGARKLEEVLDRAAESASPARSEEAPAPEIGPHAVLNEKERKVLGVLAGRRDKPALHLEELAREAFGDQEREKANSWVRNSLRRLVRDGLVERSDRGAYRATETGLARAAG